jgi:hypothetical protein
MAATHMVQRVNGPASVMREPLFGPCASVVAPSTDVGRYTSCPQLMLRRVVLRVSILDFLDGPCYVSQNTWQR